MSYDDQKELRDRQYNVAKDFEHHNEEEEDPDDDCDNEVAKSIAEVPAKVIFKKKNKNDAKLEDFQLLRIVGKGTFGKVYQVLHLPTKNVYAMKCIRKDVVLEHEQIDSLKLEKDILYNIEHQFIVGMDYVF